MRDDQKRFCGAINHAEPAFADAKVRKGIGNPGGAVVLRATGSTDADDIVENGEIERSPVAGT